jgi:hypothetical protein
MSEVSPAIEQEKDNPNRWHEEKDEFERVEEHRFRSLAEES